MLFLHSKKEFNHANVKILLAFFHSITSLSIPRWRFNYLKLTFSSFLCKWASKKERETIKSINSFFMSARLITLSRIVTCNDRRSEERNSMSFSNSGHLWHMLINQLMNFTEFSSIHIDIILRCVMWTANNIGKYDFFDGHRKVETST